MASNLAVQLTTFVGRERELAELRQLLQDVRLLTLVGAGGIGKTRLAIELAQEMERAGAQDGVWLVELAAMRDPTLVAQAVAGVLDIRERSDQSLHATLCQHLERADVALLLDNCEHLIGGCAELAEALLRACPRVRIIATSRQPLGVAGETTWRVPALRLPVAQSDSASDDVGASEAARLFVERTRSVLPAFALSDRNARAVAQICRQLDGIPLAIELAAARTSALGLDQILSRLDDRFRLLGAPLQRADPRHQTLRATVQWSHDLLTRAEQVVFRRLSVFAGGWTLEAAEAVCADQDVPREDVLDHLARLVNQSLVLVEGQDSVARYGLLETLRQFAGEQLDAADEGAVVRQRHLEWYFGLAERGDAELNGPRQSQWLEVFEREHDNLRAALRWSLESGSIEHALGLAVACSYFWEIRGHRYRSEGRRWLEDGLAGAASASPTARARALYWAGTFAGEQHDFDAATAHLDASLRAWLEIGNNRGVAESQLGLGIVFRDMGEYARAEVLLEESLARSRQAGDRLKVARVLRGLGTVATRLGEGDRGVSALTESLETLLALGESHLVGHVLDHLGEAELGRGAVDRAIDAQRRGVALLQAAGCMEGVNSSLYLEGCIAQRRGDRAEAVALAVRSLRGYRVLGNRRDLPACFELIAESIAERRPARAAQLFGAADTLREAIHLPLPPANRAPYDAAVALVQTLIGAEVFDAARSGGRRLGRDEAIDLAIDSDVLPSIDASSTGPLTAREVEVVRLIGRGLSNKEIAQQLVLSVRTAEAHVTNVLNKLGLRSRSQLAVWAAERGLLSGGGDDGV